MSDHVKLPVLSTASLALEWTLFVVRRHWLMVLAYTLVPFSFILIVQRYFPIKVGRNVDPTPFLMLFGAVPIYSASLVVLALVTHNEVLRGAAGLDAATLGRGGSRAFGYILDVLLVTLGVLIGVIGIVVIGRLVGLGSHPPGPEGLVVFVFIALWVLAVLAIQRLLLRLPSRALGQPLSWRDVWRLGHGNSWRLLGCIFLISAVVGIGLSAIMLLLQLVFMPNFLPVHPPLAGGDAIPSMPFASPDTPFVLAAMVALIMGLSYPVNTILLCAFLSLAYVALRDGGPESEGLVSA